MTLSRAASCHALVTIAAAMVAGLAGCRDRPGGKTDSATSDRAAYPPITGATARTGWDSTAGPVMVIADSRTPSEVAIVLPGLTDSALATTARFELDNLAKIPIDLFGLQGQVGSSVLEVSSQSSDSTACIHWPTGRLVNPVPRGWTVGLEKGRAVGLRLHSLEGMTSTDSVQFVADVIRAARSVVGGDPAFRGIPLSVRKGYRLMLPGTSVIIAEVVRKINEEANPREEHLFLLAERSGNEPQYHVSFHTRSAGSEESLETSEVLAAIRLTKTGTPAIVSTFDYEEGGKVGLFERRGENDWQVIWKSAYAGC